MLSTQNMIAIACTKMIELFGKDYMQKKFLGACHSKTFLSEDEFEFFCGFEGNDTTNKWTVFARIMVNCESGETQVLDYKLPNGLRMKNPIKPVLLA